MPPTLVLADAHGRELGSSYGGGYSQGIINGSNGVPWVFADGPGTNRDEAPPAQPRDIRRMLDIDGKALQVSQALTLPLIAADWDTTGDAEQAQWTKDWMARLDPSWDVVMGQLAGASMYARAVFEIVWDIGPDGRVCPTRIAFRPLDNTMVVLDDNGQPASLEQRLQGQTIEIPAERSLIYLHNEHRAPGVGVSDIGPVWQNHWRKKALVALWAIYLNRAAQPWIEANSINATDPKQLSSFARTVATIKSGGVVGTGAGESLKALDAGGHAGVVFEAALTWLDRQMTASTLTSFLDLGQSKVGSFALSKDHSDFFTLGREAVLKAIAGAVNKHVVIPAVRANWGANVDGPRLAFDQLTEGNQDQMATLLGQLAIAPAINPAIPAAFVRQLVLSTAKNLGLDTDDVQAGLDTQGTPDAQMASAANGAVHVLRTALPTFAQAA